MRNSFFGLVILSLFFLLNSCSSDINIEGRWGRLLRGGQIDEVDIYKNGSSYVVKIGKDKLPAILENDALIINGLGGQVAVIDQTTDHLLFQGNEYFRIPNIEATYCSCEVLTFFKWNQEACNPDVLYKTQDKDYFQMGECWNSGYWDKYKDEKKGFILEDKCRHCIGDRPPIFLTEKYYNKYVKPFKDLEGH